MTSFSAYLVGFLILIIGLALAAYLLGVPSPWIAAGVIVLIGIGNFSAVNRNHHRPGPH